MPHKHRDSEGHVVYDQAETMPEYLRYPHYAENGSTRTWFVVAIGVLAPIAAIPVLVVGVRTNQQLLLVPFFALLFLWLLSIGTRACWGVGIRIGDGGIRIGGCKRTSRWWWRLWERIRFVSGSSTTRPTTYTVFAPWDGIRSVRVVTDPAEMKRLILGAPRQQVGSALNNTLRYYWQVGAIVPFYAMIWRHLAVRGFLVFDVDPNQAQVPKFRKPSRHFAMPPASTWMCPTRKPNKLRRVVAELRPLLDR
jgi:hypothetical protein